MTFKAFCMAVALSFCFGITALALAADPQSGTEASNLKITVDSLDLLSLSISPTVERKVRIDTDNIWPETDAIQEEYIVPLGTIISYKAGPSPSEVAGLTIQRLYHRQPSEDDLELYVNYTSNDTDALVFVDVFHYTLADKAAVWPPTDDEKLISFTFAEAGMYGVNAVYMDDNEETYPASIYWVIQVVEDTTAVGEKPTDPTESAKAEDPGQAVTPTTEPSDGSVEHPYDNTSCAITFTLGSLAVSRGEMQLPEPPLAPQMINGYTMLPFRYLVETVLGGSVEYATETRTITATIDDHLVVMTVDNMQISLDGVIHDYGQAPVVIDGTTLLPLETFATFLKEIIEVNPAS